MSFKLDKSVKVTEHNYDYLLVDLNLITLANRRIFLSLFFLHNILSGVLPAPNCLNVYDCMFRLKLLDLTYYFTLSSIVRF